jgi:hypothetical protein
MASKSKQARLAPKRNISRALLYWAISVFIIKLIIIFNIPAGVQTSGNNSYQIDGIWLGADGENYLKGYFGLLKDGVFSTENLLSYWPAGYPLVILLLSLIGKSFVLTTLSIIQSIIYSFAAYFFASQLAKTRLRKFTNLVFAMILLNPTLSLSSIAIGYESLTASGYLIVVGLIIKDFTKKDDSKLLKYVVISSIVVGSMSFMQPRLIVSGILINLIWILIRKPIKSSHLLLITTLALTLFFPATLIYRNNKAIGVNSISTNLGVTMNIGAGDKATGGYSSKDFGVPCKISGTDAQKDNQRVACVIKWYLDNPVKAGKLFYSKTLYFWSPWEGHLANGTMARNPWLKISPIVDIQNNSENGDKLVRGPIGWLFSWLWLLGGLGLVLYGFIILWRLKQLEKLIGLTAIIIIASNWGISLLSIGDHRFRLPVMGMSLFLQAVGLKTLFKAGKPPIVDGPSLR